MQNRVVYPGTFDPITNGHLDVTRRASAIFDEVIVAVAENHDKRPMFSVDERVEMVKLATQALTNVQVTRFGSLLVECVKEQKARVIMRGLRAVSDFEYELQMGYANESLDPEIETIYLMPTLQYAFISSSVVRSILQHKGGIDKIDKLVPSVVANYINTKKG
ncbi:phosphopantetheine adenylyltransferase [Campylobacterota bacterium]|nr:phosphopantetheine adenylyltransferase [Campylobacterota bacterium]